MTDRQRSAGSLTRPIRLEQRVLGIHTSARVGEHPACGEREVPGRGPRAHPLRDGQRLADELARAEIQFLREQCGALEEEDPTARCVLDATIRATEQFGLE